MKNKIILLFVFNLLILITNSCKKEFQYKNSPNAVKTLKVSNVLQTTAKIEAQIITDNGAYLTARGICFNVEGNPTIANLVKSDPNPDIGNFSGVLENLLPNTTYYARAFATNGYGTAYGNIITFKTLVATIPIITSTTEANLITQVSAKSGGVISNSGASNVTSRGVCWSSSVAKPTILNSKTIDGIGIGTFVSSLSGLTPNSIYYVRAYATNSVGTAYGDVKTFTTSTIAIPVLSLALITSITFNSAISGGTITSDGGVSVITKGVCWSNTTLVPSISNSKTIDGTGIGSFSSSITGLLANTTYYVRAYSTNSVGTGYSSIISFKTSSPILPKLSTSSVSSISHTTGLSGGIISSDEGSAITARGVCWSNITMYPTIVNSKTVNGTGIGSFSSSITGLIPNTTYYVRAYATNIAGTAYGDLQTIKTLAPSLPLISSISTSAISYKTGTSGGIISSDEGSAITERGVCWSNTTSSPTIYNTRTVNGSGIGSFSSSLTGLNANTTYYVRAYATNSVGTAYGNFQTFKTLAPSLPLIISNSISSIGSTTGTSGGFITSDEGSAITARGICWSNTTSSPTITNSKTIDGSGIGSFSSSLTGLNANTTYYVRAYATNSVGTSYGDLKTFKTLQLSVGESYQGGIIAYIFQPGDIGYITNQFHGIIALSKDLSTGAEWGCAGYLITSGTLSLTLGYGQSNTQTISARCSTFNIAANLCYNLISNGYSDWYLPSGDELYKLYLNKSLIGGFNSNVFYWSSSKPSDLYTFAYAMSFSNGTIVQRARSSSYYVRAIRYF